MAGTKTATAKEGGALKAQKLKGAENVSVAVSPDKILITVSRKVPGRVSKSGKNVVSASTLGNKPIPGTELTMGLNIYGPVENDEE